jgi:anti-anti-sigma factor
MNITEHPGADWLELRLVGRLDATWADHVSQTIETAIRAGSHRVVLNFAGVDYISSLGIRLLVKHYKQLKAVSGSLSVREPSEATLAVLTTVGLAGLLLSDVAQPDPTAAELPPPVARGGVSYQVYPQPAMTPLTCAAVGRPERLGAGGFDAEDCRTLTFGHGTFGLGLGGFGRGFADCQDRFGEFLAAGGCAITMPTNDAQALPDYLVEEGGLVPRVEVLYALAGAGDFASMVRFDPAPDGPGTVGLSALVDALMGFSGSGPIAFVVLAEAAGLVGATLRRSPAGVAAALELPAVRDWISFTTERVAERSLALLVGVAAPEVSAGAASFLRPLKADTRTQAHVHAAMFPYRPVQQGELRFRDTVINLLGASTPSTVMHLMADARPFEGVGETDLVRGACWVGALNTISVQ